MWKFRKQRRHSSPDLKSRPSKQEVGVLKIHGEVRTISWLRQSRSKASHFHFLRSVEIPSAMIYDSEDDKDVWNMEFHFVIKRATCWSVYMSLIHDALSVGSVVTDLLRIRVSTFGSYYRKNRSIMGRCISYLLTSRKPTTQLRN
jgi:hypothetical protein